MSTAQKLIEGAARLIGIKRTGISLSDSQLEDGLETLNDMLLEMQAQNIKIPCNIVSTPTGEVGEDDWTTSYLKTKLSLRLAPEYTIPVSAELMRMYKDARKAVYSALHDLSDVVKPDILPIGSGNQDVTWNQREFYANRRLGQLESSSGDNLEDNEGNSLLDENGGSHNVLTGG